MQIRHKAASEALQAGVFHRYACPVALKMSKPASIAILFVISLLWLGCGTGPSDESLEKRFYKQRANLERLVAMMHEDSQIIRVDPILSVSKTMVLGHGPKGNGESRRNVGVTIEKYFGKRVSQREHRVQ